MHALSMSVATGAAADATHARAAAENYCVIVAVGGVSMTGGGQC